MGGLCTPTPGIIEISFLQKCLIQFLSICCYDYRFCDYERTLNYTVHFVYIETFFLLLSRFSTRRNHPYVRSRYCFDHVVRKVSNMYDWFAEFSAVEKLNLIRLFSVRFWRNSMKNNRLSAARGIFRLVENRQCDRSVKC